MPSESLYIRFANSEDAKLVASKLTSSHPEVQVQPINDGLRVTRTDKSSTPYALLADLNREVQFTILQLEISEKLGAKIKVKIIPCHSNRGLVRMLSRDLTIFSNQAETAIQQISDYAGPAAACYFTFMRRYTMALAPLAIVAFLNFALMPYFLMLYFLGFAFLVPFDRVFEEDGGPESSLRFLRTAYATPDLSPAGGFLLAKTLFLIFLSFCVASLFGALKIGGSYLLSTYASLLSLSFPYVVKWIAKKEEHENSESFKKSLILKSVTLRLVVNLFIPVYLVLLDPSRVHDHVRKQFTVSQIFGAVFEIAPALTLLRFTEHRSPQSADWTGTTWDPNDEFLEMATQFTQLAAVGFLFPQSFLFAFINNLLESYLDAEKLSLAKRPAPSNVNIAEIWKSIFKKLVLIAALVNVLMLFVETFHDRNQSHKLVNTLIVLGIVRGAHIFFQRIRT